MPGNRLFVHIMFGAIERDLERLSPNTSKAILDSTFHPCISVVNMREGNPDLSSTSRGVPATKGPAQEQTGEAQ